MKQSKIIEKLNEIMQMVMDRNKEVRPTDMEIVRIDELNLIITVIVGADQRTLNKYIDLLVKFEYIKMEGFNLYMINKWIIIDTVPLDAQTNLISYEE